MKLGLGGGMNWLWLFPGIGIVLLLGALVSVVVSQQFHAGAVRLEGTVVGHVTSQSDEGGPTYCPVVRYATADGAQAEFNGRLCSQPRANDVGDPVTVLMTPDKPGSARIDSFMERWLAALVLGFIGSIFLLIGAVFVVPPILSRRRAARLLVSGRPIQADLVEVARDGSFEVNARSPWRIHAQWQDPATRKLHLFQSDMLWFDPGEFLGEQVTVLIDPHNPKHYWIDTRFLPEVA